MVMTWLEGDIEGGAACSLSSLAQRDHLGVGFAGSQVDALGEDAAVLHQDRAHRGIGPGIPRPGRGEAQGTAQVVLVGMMNQGNPFAGEGGAQAGASSSSWNKPSAKASASKSEKSSTPSPVPT